MSTKPIISSSSSPSLSFSTSPSLSSSIITRSPYSDVPFAQLQNAITAKLEGSNYLLWKAQFLPFLQGYDLGKFVNGSHNCPPVLTPEGTPNPLFAHWIHRDKLILGWIFSTLTQPILAKVHTCVSSAEAWASLDKFFASKTEANLLHLKRELQHIKKGNQTMVDYLARAKQLYDDIVAVGHTIS
ncbi:uncharacterized protein LOC113328081 [Papaver somniferum]|uniref:uncharacterized protein LOC113328081 n=1 Tax=Papaver somniferum TaxID=3469 RepID=UPI000E7000BD|nr:uncharacterized protein LOC113328081 [Papaver somniferum]